MRCGFTGFARTPLPAVSNVSQNAGLGSEHEPAGGRTPTGGGFVDVPDEPPLPDDPPFEDPDDPPEADSPPFPEVAPVPDEPPAPDPARPSSSPEIPPLQPAAMLRTKIGKPENELRRFMARDLSCRSARNPTAY